MHVRKRLLIVLCLAAAHVALHVPLALADDAPAKAGVPPELQDALRALKSSDADVRAAKYELIRQMGDARLVPALRAYGSGLLQDLDGHLVIYGEHETLPDGQTGFPILDAFTLEQLKNADGSKRYLVRSKVDLDAPGMMRASYREKMHVLPELISSLSLLDPDEDRRVASIADAADKSIPALYAPQWAADLMSGLDRDTAALEAEVARNGSAPLTADCKAALASIASVKQQYEAQTSAGERFSTPLSALEAKLRAAAKTAENDPVAKQSLSALPKPVSDYEDQLEIQRKAVEDIKRVRPILALHLSREKSKKFQRYLKVAIARMDLVIGDRDAKIAAARTLGEVGTIDGQSTLERALDNAGFDKQPEVQSAVRDALARVRNYQVKVRFAENTFAGLSLSSILVLLALGLSIIFGLMGVINMAHGEFMMVGAFATWGVSEWFHGHMPGAFEYYLIAAIPAAFLAAAVVGWMCEALVVRHLYGRPLDTLLATWGVGFVLIATARKLFGDNMHVTSPRWLEGGLEVAPDLVFARNRLFIIAYCVLCIVFVYLIVNRTRLGLLLRATTQSRQTAMSLGVATRRVDAFTFALGAGLAGLAGVAVTLYDKINPQMGQDYVVESFMVVVVGGVGKLAGAILAGLGLGMTSKYLEPILGSVKAMSSSPSVFTKVFVLLGIIAFLQRRPQGLFPPKGRLSDA